MNNILIGNIISFTGAVFLAVSCVVKSRKQIFVLQFLNCAFLAVASYFFNAYATITTLIICCIRNIFIMRDVYKRQLLPFRLRLRGEPPPHAGICKQEYLSAVPSFPKKASLFQGALPHVRHVRRNALLLCLRIQKEGRLSPSWEADRKSVV